MISVGINARKRKNIISFVLSDLEKKYFISYQKSAARDDENPATTAIYHIFAESATIARCQSRSSCICSGLSPLMSVITRKTGSVPEPRIHR